MNLPTSYKHHPFETRCRSCEALIVWFKTKAGKPAFGDIACPMVQSPVEPSAPQHEEWCDGACDCGAVRGFR